MTLPGDRRLGARARLGLTAAALVSVLLALAPGVAQAGAPLPPQGAPPPGANDFGCRPPPRHPYPVVLVHGTFGNMTVSWNSVAPALERLGYCVFALDYGNSPLPGINATGDIPTSASELQTFVDRVLSATGASKVSIVGHSQGGMMPRYYMKFLGGAGKVDDLVGLSPSNHGTTNPLAGPAAPFCPACAQQVAGSSFLAKLNAGDQTPPPASYTVVETRNDEVVTPYTSEFLPAGSRVTNILLQNRCPADPTDHVGIIYDPVAIQWMLDALGRPGPADPGFKPDCSGAALASFPDSSSVAPSSAGGGGGTGSAHAARTTLRLAAAVAPRRVRRGARVHLRVRLRDTGRATARRATVCARLPRGFRALSARGARRHGTRMACWRIRALGAHHSRTLRLTARVGRRARAGRARLHVAAVARNARRRTAVATLRIRPRR